MFSRLFPKQFDNNYRGYKLAIWLLVPIVLSKLFMGVNVAGFNPWISSRWVLQHADAIPIDRFGAEAGSVVVFLFSAWGLALLVLSLLGVMVLIRYRTMIPLMYLLLGAEQIGRKALSLMHPIVRTSEPGDFSPGVLINWGFTALLAFGLALSLAAPREAKASIASREGN
jgi:hypothetical protein